MVEYTYDAWGNHTMKVAEDEHAVRNELVGNLNPIRYRSYYFDTDSGMYWLTTRFYDPKTGRFISQDEYSYLDPESINGLNLYAYCGNEPIMRTDETGSAWWEWLLAGVVVAGLVVGAIFTGGLVAAAFAGAAIGGAISLGTQAISGELNWGQFALDIGVGALTGLIGGSGISRGGATLLGSVIGGASNFASQLINGTSLKDVSFMQVLTAGAIGAVASFMGGAGARNKNAINHGKGVQTATNKLNKVVRRIANGTRYKSTTSAQVAFRSAMDGLTYAIQSQMDEMFAVAMFAYGSSTIMFNILNSWFEKQNAWLF